MQTSESRREKRHKLLTHPKGKLSVHVDGDRIPVLSVRDISIKGISLVLRSNEFEKGVVTIEYRSQGIDIKVEGAVAWKVKEEDENGHPLCVLGVELMGSSMLLTSMKEF